ncbi:MAG: hypothetical protein DI598_04355 [Pseudopedobacter saltans]|uniref:Galactose oxidase n=1 Tax=Pseudopedobacter saltans TaxID=151895 RepID=A0A2W5HB24_9SPHI|nr:MAG: hypothetical protein DI598_04355 [Pseudopedobacter saltans]
MKKHIVAFVASTAFLISCSKSSGNGDGDDSSYVNKAPQGTWAASNIMPTSGGLSMVNMGRIGAISMLISGYNYIGLGSTIIDSVQGTYKSLGDFWQIDYYNGTLTQMASMPNGGRRYASAFAIDYKGYVGGGYSDSLATNLKDFYQYNSASNTWTRKPDIPFSSGRQQGFGFAITDLGYMGGGRDNNGLPWSDVYRYNPNTEVWTSVAAFPGDKKYGATSFTYDNKAYICGGYPLSTDFFSFNGTDWMQLHNIANVDSAKYDDQYTNIARVNATAFVINGWAYLVGGSGNSNVWSYDIANDLWYPNTKLPISDNDVSSLNGVTSFVNLFDNKAYIVLGLKNSSTNSALYNSYNNGVTNVYQFTPGSK